VQHATSVRTILFGFTAAHCGYFTVKFNAVKTNAAEDADYIATGKLGLLLLLLRLFLCSLHSGNRMRQHLGGDNKGGRGAR
jgi:hypothetical protein